MSYFNLEPDPMSTAIDFCRLVDNSEQQIDLEERALNNYLNEVRNVHSCNFVYNPSLHPVSINMYLNPNHYLGEAASRC